MVVVAEPGLAPAARGVCSFRAARLRKPRARSAPFGEQKKTRFAGFDKSELPPGNPRPTALSRETARPARSPKLHGHPVPTVPDPLPHFLDHAQQIPELLGLDLEPVVGLGDLLFDHFGHSRIQVGRGYGSRLFDRAVMHARNDGVDMMFIHALSENTAMLNIARKAGATIVRDGSESEAYLKLPPADLDSRMTEMVEEQIAQTDYRLKVQAKQFWDMLAKVQEVRQGVRDGRDRMPM